MEAISTVALLDLLSLPDNTASARRITPIMLALQFIPIRSRKIPPGGWRTTTARGWSRSVREPRMGAKVGNKVASTPLAIATKQADHQDGERHAQ